MRARASPSTGATPSVAVSSVLPDEISDHPPVPDSNEPFTTYSCADATDDPWTSENVEAVARDRSKMRRNVRICRPAVA
jgi:hypothetical protein